LAQVHLKIPNPRTNVVHRSLSATLVSVFRKQTITKPGFTRIRARVAMTLLALQAVLTLFSRRG
jgi:hypothetical protein